MPKAVTPSEITIAVSTIANGSGSVIASGSPLPSKGGSPGFPAAMMNSRFTPLPSSTKPRMIRLRVRSRTRYTPQATSTPAVSRRVRLTDIGLHLLLLVDLRAEGAQEVEHHADHDEVHAEVEQEGAGEMQLPQQRHVHHRGRGRVHGPAQQQRQHTREHRDRHTAAEHEPGLDGGGLGELVAATSDIAQREREAGDETAGEAAAGKVVPGHEQVDG